MSTTQVLSLPQALRQFLRFTSPRLLFGAFVLAFVARIAVGGWTAWDLLVPLVLVAIHPFVEWLIHVYLLHWKPRRVFGLLIDPLTARKHRRHHGDPTRVDLVFMPVPVLIGALIATPFLYLLLMPTVPLALTGLLSTLTIGLVYEWTHYICHAPYRPSSSWLPGRWLQSRIRHHRLHHFKSEKRWYGVTMHLGDRVLGTLPDPGEVELSPTVRSILTEEEARA